MISQTDLPTQNFTVDDMVIRGHDRAEIVSTLRQLEQQGRGVFVIGRRGSKSRFQWSKQLGLTTSSTIEQTPTPTNLADEQLQTLANIVSLCSGKENPSFETLCHHLDQVMKEVCQLRENTVIEEPAGIKHVPLEWLTKNEAINGWSFWEWNQRQEIAEELLAYRRGK